LVKKTTNTEFLHEFGDNVVCCEAHGHKNMTWHVDTDKILKVKCLNVIIFASVGLGHQTCIQYKSVGAS
jgi:ATP-dependent RNA circularization protein (DNA/RNA ligase family)